MLRVNSQGEELGGKMSPPMKEHLELEIKTLQHAPRDADKLERLLKVKEREKEEAMHKALLLLEKYDDIPETLK
jgi:hypothetical protein